VAFLWKSLFNKRYKDAEIKNIQNISEYSFVPHGDDIKKMKNTDPISGLDVISLFERKNIIFAIKYVIIKNKISQKILKIIKFFPLRKISNA
tara:strand:+ start:904 stop:1179 length:276 start_codon:yes stop_codon:yes gene_type:complete